MHRSFHSIHNVVEGGVLQAMWEELVGKVEHRDQLIICYITTPACLKTLCTLDCLLCVPTQ